ncbi:hypothetical protein GOP47_0029519 [Adiantum capillus-veneris]|nr:hypothetical protein GOP47_0029519 [Adiantum capillus-veneris]
MAGRLTDRQLAQAELPVLPGRLSQRRSSSRTVPTAPRSFSSLEEWPNFLQDARMLSNTLDDTAPSHLNVMDVFADAPLESAADEIGVRVAIESVMFPRINKLAAKFNIPWRYVQGGSGRSLSYTDIVIMSDDPQPTGNRRELSRRIFGNGEVKGPWQWEILRDVTYAARLIDKKKGQAMKEVLQQLFGDMVLDETKYGFITNYNSTVFFRRTDLKSLQFSPVVAVEDAPLEKFFLVISLAYRDRLEKHALSRVTVPDTPPQGYKIAVAQGEMITRSGRLSARPTITVSASSSSRKRPRSFTTIDFFQEHGAFETLGISGNVIGFAKYGNVLEGEFDHIKLALKTYDFRFEAARTAYLHEELLPFTGFP